MDRRTDGLMAEEEKDRSTDGLKNRRAYGRKDRQIGVQISRWTEEQMDLWQKRRKTDGKKYRPTE